MYGESSIHRVLSTIMVVSGIHSLEVVVVFPVDKKDVLSS